MRKILAGATCAILFLTGVNKAHALYTPPPTCTNLLTFKPIIGVWPTVTLIKASPLQIITLTPAQVTGGYTGPIASGDTIRINYGFCPGRFSAPIGGVIGKNPPARSTDVQNVQCSDYPNDAGWAEFTVLNNDDLLCPQSGSLSVPVLKFTLTRQGNPCSQ